MKEFKNEKTFVIQVITNEGRMAIQESNIYEVEKLILSMVGEKKINVQLRERLGRENLKSKTVKGSYNENFIEEFRSKVNCV